LCGDVFLGLNNSSASTSHYAGEMHMTCKENGEFYVVTIFLQPGVTTMYVWYGLILFVEI